jgi:PAS domain S-box-containing protein
MMEQPDDSASEVARLQRCMNDLVSVQALSSIWAGAEEPHIVQTLLDTLLRMLRLDLVYARVDAAGGLPPIEMVRSSESRAPRLGAGEVAETLRRRLGDDPRRWPPVAPNPFGEGGLAFLPLRLGPAGESGMLVAASPQADFPGQTEALLLNVAVNQALTALQEARLRSEQKRAAKELDQRVAQRTAELARANEELRKEIAERGLAERKLHREEVRVKRSEGHKAAILNAALDCVVAIDHEGRITEFNAAAERTLGYGRNDVIGRNLADVVVPPSLRERHLAGFARHLATGESSVLGRHVEMTALRADGREIPVEIAITRIEQDGPPAFTGCLRDITQRKRNEEALREAHTRVARSEERWRSVFENSAIGVALTDPNGRFIAANPVYEKMLGYSEEELQQLTSVDITHEEHLEPNAALVAELLAGTRKQFVVEKQYRRKDGRLVWVRNNVSLVPGSERVPRFLMALSEDITERKQAEQAQAELAHVTRALSMGALTASIAHEVNQPLAGIITNAGTCLRMLGSEPPNVEGARETARRTIRDGNRASEVIARLRALYGNKGTAFEPLDLNETVREVIALLLNELQQRRVMVRTELAGDLPPVSGDRVQLQQVVLNLLRNAADAMSDVHDRPRNVLVRTERERAGVARLSVTDAGVGLDPQAAEKLFEMFYTTKSDGMGIGLSVSRSIIESHHGRLWAAPNDGPGATFSFSIPCRPDT